MWDLVKWPLFFLLSAKPFQGCVRLFMACKGRTLRSGHNYWYGLYADTCSFISLLPFYLSLCANMAARIRASGWITHLVKLYLPGPSLSCFLSSSLNPVICIPPHTRSHTIGPHGCQGDSNVSPDCEHRWVRREEGYWYKNTWFAVVFRQWVRLQWQMTADY